MKRMCAMCREAKEESEFYYRKKLKTYNAYCSSCNRLYQKEYKRIWRERKKAMIKCPDCNKFGSCDKASGDVIECLDFIKQPYMALVETDGEIKRFERID